MSPRAGPGQNPGGVQGAKPLEAPGISRFLEAGKAQNTPGSKFSFLNILR